MVVVVVIILEHFNANNLANKHQIHACFTINILVISAPGTKSGEKLIKQSWVFHLTLTDDHINLSTSKWGLLVQSTYLTHR